MIAMWTGVPAAASQSLAARLAVEAHRPTQESEDRCTLSYESIHEVISLATMSMPSNRNRHAVCMPWLSKLCLAGLLARLAQLHPLDVCLLACYFLTYFLASFLPSLLACFLKKSCGQKKLSPRYSPKSECV
jgi:hypothetical protein